MVRLLEYYQDPGAPRAQDVLPAAFAAVRDSAGEILLVRRIDDGFWELPGGRVEVGESAAQAVIREVEEESGITIALTGIWVSTAIPRTSWSIGTTASTAARDLLPRRAGGAGPR